MTGSELLPVLRKFLAKTATMTLATVDEAGMPHAASVNFMADDDLNLYWLSKTDSAHSLHLAARPRIAAAIYAPFRLPVGIRGLQLHGRAEQMPADRFDPLWSLFCKRFIYAIPFKARAQSERFYRLTPDWLRWIDNSVRFGFKVETCWPPGN